MCYRTSNLIFSNYPVVRVQSYRIKTTFENYFIDGLIKYNHVLFKAGLTGVPVTPDVVPDNINIITKNTGGALWKKSILKKRKYSRY